MQKALLIAVGSGVFFMPTVDGEVRPQVFSRKQHKYNHFANFQESWIDRPLFHNREDRPPQWDFEYFNKASLAEEIQQAQNHGLDGLSAFVTGSGLAHYRNSEKIWQHLNPSGFRFMAEIGGNPHTPKPEEPGSLLNQIRESLKVLNDSKFTWKINGKTVVASYVVDRYPPGDWEKVFGPLREEFDGKVLFVVDLPVSAARLHRAFQLDPSSLDREREIFKDAVRSYLQVADGVMIASANHMDRRDGSRYAAAFDEDFYHTCLIPLLKEVLAEPPYQGKLLGLSASKGYINHDSGVVNGEDGTNRLRRSLQIVCQAQPDFITLPEWNEVNENTSFQPTVASSFSTSRILHHFMRQLKGEKAVGLPGDDSSVPNLVLSHRRILKLGEEVKVEVLNIPDDEGVHPVSVALSLKSITGEVLRAFAPQPLDAKELQAVVFSAPSEMFAGNAALLPSLRVTDAKGKTYDYEDGLPHIQIRPTWNWDYLEVHQPLRDLLQPDKGILQIDGLPSPTGVHLQGVLASKEELAHVEILEDQTEIFASDRTGEFDRTKFVVIRCQFIGGEAKVFKGTISVRDGGEFQIRSTGYPSDNFAPGSISGDTITLAQRVNSVPRGFFLLIPKENAAKAMLEFHLDGESFDVPVRDLLENGSFAKALPGRYVVSLWRYDKLPDVAPPLRTQEATFAFTARPNHSFPVYSLRAITKSGKIYRSRPIAPFVPSGVAVPLNVFSESQGKPVTLSLRSDELPKLHYLFQKDRGDLLGSTESADWNGEVGGGINYGGPRRMGPNIPKNAIQANPQWVEEDGAVALEFDGVGNLIAFPKEAFPHASFTLRFEIKPESDRNEILFQHHALRSGSLALRRENGKLLGSFSDPRLSARENSTTTVFPTRLEIPKGQWSAVEVSYNLKELVFTVNGKSESFAFSQPAAFYQASIFGGPAATGPGGNHFRGYLKSFSIDHFAPVETRERGTP